MVPQASRIVPESAIFDGTYELLATVGRGRNSVVYQARRLPSRKLQIAGPSSIALKVLVENPKNPDANIKRMRRESLALLACRHPNIIRLYDFITSESLCYLAMEYAEGGDLRAMLEARGEPFPFEFSCSVIIEVLKGLEAIHHAGIIHRDIKPENLLLTKDQQVKITDFGVAFLPVEKPDLDDTTLAVGTLDYLAPECLEQTTIDLRADLYSVAVTFYQLFTGHLPFEGSALAAQINDKLTGNFRTIEHGAGAVHSGMLESFFRKAFAPEAADRFQTAREFREAIEQLRDGVWRSDLNFEKSSAAPKKLLALDPDVAEVPEVAPQAAAPVFHDTQWMEENRMQMSGTFKAFTETPEAMPGKSEKRPSKKQAHFKANVGLAAKRAGVFLAALMVAGLVFANRGQLKNLSKAFSKKPKHKVEAVVEISPEVLEEAANAPTLETVSAATAVNFDGERTGILENIFADGADLPFVVAVHSKTKAVVALGLIGFEPIEIDPSALLRGEKVSISGSGLALNLRAETTVSGDSSGIRGTYRELSTGKEGRFRLW